MYHVVDCRVAVVTQFGSSPATVFTEKVNSHTIGILNNPHVMRLAPQVKLFLPRLPTIVWRL